MQDFETFMQLCQTLQEMGFLIEAETISVLGYLATCILYQMASHCIYLSLRFRVEVSIEANSAYN